MSETELKPCPFCGGRAAIHVSVDSFEIYSYVACGNARCKVHPRTDGYLHKGGRTKAAAAWNRRAE